MMTLEEALAIVQEAIDCGGKAQIDGPTIPKAIEPDGFDDMTAAERIRWRIETSAREKTAKDAIEKRREIAQRAFDKRVHDAVKRILKEEGAEIEHLRGEGLPFRFTSPAAKPHSKPRATIKQVAAHVREMAAGTEFTTSDIVDAVGGSSNTITNGIKRAQEEGVQIERLNQTTYKVA